MKIKVGQIVYLEPTDNAFLSKKIIKTKVKKVGREYFEVENNRSKFYIKEMCEVTDYFSGYAVYLSMQEIKDKNEKKRINMTLRKFFLNYRHNNLSLAQLRQIQKAIYNITLNPDFKYDSSDLVRCQTCGSACRIYSSGEGTNSFDPVIPYREQEKE